MQKSTHRTAMKSWNAVENRGESPRCPRGDGQKTVRVALLVFVSCSLVLMLTKAHRYLSSPLLEKPLAVAVHDGLRPRVDPVGFALSRVSTVAMAYLSSAACGGQYRWTLEETVSRARRTWKRPAATLLCVELLATASSSLLWTLVAFTRGASGAAAEAVFISAVAALGVWLAPVLFAHSEIACKLSVVVSIAEEGCEGMDALRSAGELVRGRKLRGLVLTTLLAQLEQAPSAVFGLGKRGGEWKGEALTSAAAWSLMIAAVHLMLKLLSYLAYTKFYHDCKKSHGKE